LNEPSVGKAIDMKTLKTDDAMKEMSKRFNQTSYGQNFGEKPKAK
jgi:hypothetical protein